MRNRKSRAHARFSGDSPVSTTTDGLVGGEGWIRTLGSAQYVSSFCAKRWTNTSFPTGVILTPSSAASTRLSARASASILRRKTTRSALRHQIPVLERNRFARAYGSSDRLLWILLSHWWRGWRESPTDRPARDGLARGVDRRAIAQRVVAPDRASSALTGFVPETTAKIRLR
jgi:hypothetical protein